MAKRTSSEPRDLLRRLAAGDERSLQAVLAPTPEFEAGEMLIEPALDRRCRALVRLAALLSVGACTTTVRWALELASTAGAGDDAVAAVLVATAPATGAAQVVASAPRLALALGVELELEGLAPGPAS